MLSRVLELNLVTYIKSSRTTLLSGTARKREYRLERSDHTRYSVRAPVAFEWIENGEPRSGRGLTRDISSEGMFIYSDSEPPAKVEIQVEVFLGVSSEPPTKLRLKAKSLVVRTEVRPDTLHGFAVLNRSCKLHDGVTPIDDG